MSQSETAGTGQHTVRTFAFGDPEPVMDRRMLFEMLQSTWNGRWYEPPVPPDGLARAFIASTHHESAMRFKAKLLTRGFVASRMLGRGDFLRMALDLQVFGNAYVERLDNRFGRAAKLGHAPAKWVRRARDTDDGKPQHVQIVAGKIEPHRFAPGAVCQIMTPDINQELYGVPEYLSALQSALLNEAATLFRRKYYRNGSHAGYILHLDGGFAEADVDAVETALKKSQGPGNFRNLLLHTTGGKDTVKLLPISEVAAKDEFLGIKGVTRDDVLAAHRCPPQLLGIIPTNAGGFGNVTDAVEAFYWLEIVPLQQQMLEINEWLGEEAVRFEDPGRPVSTAPMGGGKG